MAIVQEVRLDDETQARLNALGELRKRTPDALVQAAIQRYLEQEENYEGEKQEDQERWEQYQRTGKAISHDIAAAWLGDLAQGKVTPCPK